MFANPDAFSYIGIFSECLELYSFEDTVFSNSSLGDSV